MLLFNFALLLLSTKILCYPTHIDVDSSKSSPLPVLADVLDKRTADFDDRLVQTEKDVSGPSLEMAGSLQKRGTTADMQKPFAALRSKFSKKPASSDPESEQGVYAYGPRQHGDVDQYYESYKPSSKSRITPSTKEKMAIIAQYTAYRVSKKFSDVGDGVKKASRKVQYAGESVKGKSQDAGETVKGKFQDIAKKTKGKIAYEEPYSTYEESYSSDEEPYITGEKSTRQRN